MPSLRNVRLFRYRPSAEIDRAQQDETDSSKGTGQLFEQSEELSQDHLPERYRELPVDQEILTQDSWNSSVIG